MDEHKVIERMLNVLNVASDKFEAGEQVSPGVFKKAIDFIKGFGDSCHHGKEEDALFVALESHGLPKQSGPIGVMLMEHEQGRGYVRRLTQAVEKYERGDETAKRAIIENSRGYASLLSSHILKEDNVLYPMADRTLPSSEQTELLEKFEKIEKEKIGEGRHEHYLHLVSGLEKQLGIEGSEIEYEHH